MPILPGRWSTSPRTTAADQPRALTRPRQATKASERLKAVRASRGDWRRARAISDAAFSPHPLSRRKAHPVRRPKPAVAACPSADSQLGPIRLWEKHRPGEGVFPIVGLKRLLDRCHHDLAFLERWRPSNGIKKGR